MKFVSKLVKGKTLEDGTREFDSYEVQADGTTIAKILRSIFKSKPHAINEALTEVANNAACAMLDQANQIFQEKANQINRIFHQPADLSKISWNYKGAPLPAPEPMPDYLENKETKTPAETGALLDELNQVNKRVEPLTS